MKVSTGRIIYCLISTFALGPLELTRRTKVLVWDEEVEAQEDDLHHDDSEPPLSPAISASSVPIPGRARSQSYGSDFPPPMRRTSTDASGAPRPVPFAAKFQRIHPGTTGVTVLEHLERLDAVEASLQRLGVEDAEEEMDVGVSSAPPQPHSRPGSHPISISRSRSDSSQQGHSFAGPSSPLAAVPEASTPSRRSSLEEEDLVAMSKSTSHVDTGLFKKRDIGTIASAGIDWVSADGDEDAPKKILVAEVSISLAIITQ